MSLREVGWHWQDNYVITSSHGGRLGTPNGGPASWKRPSSEGSVAGCGTRRLRLGCTLEKAQLHPLCFCFSFSLRFQLQKGEDLVVKLSWPLFRSVEEQGAGQA